MSNSNVVKLENAGENRALLNFGPIKIGLTDPELIKEIIALIREWSRYIYWIARTFFRALIALLIAFGMQKMGIPEIGSILELLW